MVFDVQPPLQRRGGPLVAEDLLVVFAVPIDECGDPAANPDRTGQQPTGLAMAVKRVGSRKRLTKLRQRLQADGGQGDGSTD
jgi:hypothetical protein